MNDRSNAAPLTVGLGEILWDMLPGGKALGGATANVAVHAAALGARGAAASCVGDDDLGREILTRVDRAGLDRKYIAVDPNQPTGTVTVDLDSSGKPTFTIHEDVAWDAIPFSDALAALTAESDAVCFGSLAQRSEVSRRTIARFLAEAAGALRIFDINLRQHFYSGEIIEQSLQNADVFKLNDEELPVVVDLLSLADDPSVALAELVERFDLRLIALTLGERGSVLVTPTQESSRPASRVDVVDSVGAGDAFTAAVTVGLLAGWELSAIHERAEQVAGYVCTQAGATPPLPASLRMID